MDVIRMSGLQPSFQSDSHAVSELWRGETYFSRRESVLLTATSGSGKSSLLAYIIGERNDYRGRIIFDERETTSLTAREWSNIRKNHLSCIFQGLRLFPTLTVWDNIAVKNRLTHHKSDAEIINLLEQTGIADKRDTPASKLSFGQQQRVAIVRALCQPFDFLLADEPFSHLDEANIATVCDIITNELAARGAGMLLCSLGEPYRFNYHKSISL